VGDTHCQTLTISPFLTLYHGTMDVGNIMLKLRNDGVGICNALTNVGNDQICVDRKLGLEEVS